MAQLINFFLWKFLISALVETFYLFEDLRCCLLVSSIFINAFQVSQVLLISAAQTLTISKSQSLQKKMVFQGPKTSSKAPLSGSWVEAVACPVTPPTLPTGRSQCDFSVSQVHLWSLPAKLGSCQRQQFCPETEGQHHGPPQASAYLSTQPCLKGLAAARRMLLRKIIRTLSNLPSR